MYQRTRGADRDRFVLQAETVERRSTQLIAQSSGSVVDIEQPIVKGSFGDSFENLGGVLHASRKQHFARGEMFDIQQKPIPAIGTGKLRGPEFAGGNVEERAPELVVALVDGEQEVIFSG